MDVEKLSISLVQNLRDISKSFPNERLPKEDHIRSKIFSELSSEYKFVCSERGYVPAEDKNNNEECDLWFKGARGKPRWMEIKRCWSGSFGWVTKPKEQLESWNKDLNKLSNVDIDSFRYFFLTGVFDRDPMQDFTGRVPGVIKNIRDFQPNNLIHHHSGEFEWRDSNISNIGVWVWQWKPKEIIAI